LPATLIGTGKLEEVARRVEELEIDLVVVDGPLTPVQQRNLERKLNAKVLDRTGLILEIFGLRARTKEGRLQVELARLTYERSRLVRTWTHLERQRGGRGFLAGPGETQIEADRRLLADKMGKLRRELDEVKRTRALHRKQRERTPFALVALVGYTNAGKSTLFNRLTKAEVLAKDMVFATLDPTARSLPLPGGGTALLFDTVGFISELPPELVEAFKATLEEVLEADVIVHVRDIAHHASDDQARDVVEILERLKAGAMSDQVIIEVWNKIDQLNNEDRTILSDQARARGAFAISALSGEGMDGFLEAVDAIVHSDARHFSIEIPASEGAALSWLYDHARVSNKVTTDRGSCLITVRLGPLNSARLGKLFPGIKISAIDDQRA
jgi:GTPase